MSTASDNLNLTELGKHGTEVNAPYQIPFMLNSLRDDDIPDDILFPNELNQHLRKQIQYLTAENGRLHRELDEKETDLQTCINQNEQLLSNAPSPLIGLGRASELAASKIVELSKKVRELTAENEGAKSRWKKAEKKLKAYEDGTESVQTREKQLNSEQEEGVEPNENDVKTLTEKLNATMSKLCETRNQNQQLKQELKMANKVLASEVGENVSIQNLTSAGSNWRGRAQQILTLQQKVSNLQEKLKEQTGEEKQTVKNSGISAVRQIEKDRQAAQEQIAHELQEKTQQLEEIKRKLEATRARCRVLESEQEKKRKAIEHFMAMDEHNKELIKTMSSELEDIEKRQAEKSKQEHRKTTQWEERYKTANEMYMREKSKNEELEMIIRQKEENLQQLKAEGANYEECASVRQPNSRHSSRQHSMSPDSTLDQGENQTLLLAAEAERIRLLELVAVLNHRLEEQRNHTAEAAGSLRRERTKTARLETKVGRLEMEKHGMNRSNSYAGSRSSLSDNNAIKEGVKYKIEFMEEEILALKARLNCVQQEKEEDLKIYRNAFDEVQRVFLEGSSGQNGSPISRSIFGSQ